jgi:hypothetical protein
MNDYPVCTGCDCIDGCSKVADKACMQSVDVPKRRKLVTIQGAEFETALHVWSDMRAAARVAPFIDGGPV